MADAGWDVASDDDADEGGWSDAELVDDDDAFIGGTTVDDLRGEDDKEEDVGPSLLDVMKDAEESAASGFQAKAGFREDKFKSFQEAQRLKQLSEHFFMLCQVAQDFEENLDATSLDKVSTIFRDLYALVEPGPPNAKPHAFDKCQVCFAKWSDEHPAVEMRGCRCRSICKDCFSQYISIKVRDAELVPWILCPEAECAQYLEPADLLETMELQEAFEMAKFLTHKRLHREVMWVDCSAEECEFGFLLSEDAAKQEKRCRLCGLKQEVEPFKPKLDPEWVKLVAEGKVRECPVCGTHAMKEKGLCNIMQCGRCGIFWNWRTRETAQDMRGLKNKARGEGSLWEPGELQYQQELERTDKKAFIALLERNGIQYDPNYRRGM